MLNWLAAVSLQVSQPQVTLGDQLSPLPDEIGVQFFEIEVALAGDWGLKIAALNKLRQARIASEMNVRCSMETLRFNPSDHVLKVERAINQSFDFLAAN